MAGFLCFLYMQATNKKILGGKAYGSIGHLPGSRTGNADKLVPEGQALICTKKTRDKHDLVIVQEKNDGSSVCCYKQDYEIYPLTRAGYSAWSSPWEQHHQFAVWVEENKERFMLLLHDGERVCGEWLAQAHGTIYDLEHREPFAAFDLMSGGNRVKYSEFKRRVSGLFHTPNLLHIGGALSVEEALARHEDLHWPCDETEGVVYRVERHGKVDFLAKYVKPNKVDGKYLPEVSGKPAIWNWKSR